jgi:hypothetical protein
MNDFDILSSENIKDDEDTARRSIEAIRIIAAAMDTLGDAGSATAKPGTARVLPVAWGWFAYIVRCGALISLAHQNGFRHECGPTSRVVIQYTLTLQWLIEGGDEAVDAVETAAHNSNAALSKELIRTEWKLPEGYALAEAADPPARGGALLHQLENFKALCDLYDGADQLYVPYRLQSGSIHPSYVAARAYADPDRPERLSTRAVTDTFANLVDTARCVIQAALALAELLEGSVLADAAAEAQKAWGAAVELWQRTAKP